MLALLAVYFVQLIASAIGTIVLGGSTRTAFYWVVSFVFATPLVLWWLASIRLLACRYLFRGRARKGLLLLGVYGTRASAIVLVCGLMVSLLWTPLSTRIIWLIVVYVTASIGVGSMVWALSGAATPPLRRSLARAAILLWAAGFAIGTDMTIGLLSPFTGSLLELREKPWGPLLVALSVLPAVLFFVGLIFSILGLQQFAKEMAARRASPSPT